MIARFGQIVAVSAFLVGCGVSASGPSSAKNGPADLTELMATPACGASSRPVPILALTSSGAVEALDPATLAVEATVATQAAPDLGIAVRPELDVLYVTGRGADGLPAVWATPISDCRSKAEVVEKDAELPSVSPDGGWLGFVTLDGSGQQTGVGVVALTAGGETTGSARTYPSPSTPPPLPIRGLAVGRHNAELAVWGGFVDPYLGRRATVGTLDPAKETSLAALAVVFDGNDAGVSMVSGTNTTLQRPEDWQASPLYLPDGEFLLNNESSEGSTYIFLPYTDTTPGVSSGGDRLILKNTGSIVSLAAGSDGSLAFVGAGGTLTLAHAAVNLPFGPGASTPPPGPAKQTTAAGIYAAVAWTEGASAETAPLPPIFHIIDYLPNVVGLSQSAATAALNELELPVLVTTATDPAVPSGTVIAQNPAAGVGVACHCTVTLTISKGP